MKCNHDCFNCQFDDCVNDDLSLADYQEDDLLKEVPKSVKMARIRANKYAENHREENRVRSINHYRQNKKKYNNQSKQYAKDNPERIAAAARERYHNNIEYRRQYQRNYRERKKAERVS